MDRNSKWFLLGSYRRCTAQLCKIVASTVFKFNFSSVIRQRCLFTFEPIEHFSPSLDKRNTQTLTRIIFFFSFKYTLLRPQVYVLRFCTFLPRQWYSFIASWMRGIYIIRNTLARPHRQLWTLAKHYRSDTQPWTRALLRVFSIFPKIASVLFEITFFGFSQ